MARRNDSDGAVMVDLIGQAIAKVDGANFQTDAERYRRMAVAALGPMAKPTDAMVDAAHEAASFDAQWAINSRRDFRRAVKAMVLAAEREHSEQIATSSLPSSSPPRYRSPK